MHPHIGTEHLLLGLLRLEDSVAGRMLAERGMRLFAVREDAVNIYKRRALPKKKKETPFLNEFARDLSEMAQRRVFDPLIGREIELERVVQILSRRRKNNPVLLGEPGVGKTAIVEGLATRIVDGEVPPSLLNKRILALDLSLVVAGTKYRGQFEERLKGIISELDVVGRRHDFIDEIHSLIGAGSAEGSLDAANILKPTLSRGEVQCIGRHDPARLPQVHRKGPGAGPALPADHDPSSGRDRDHGDSRGRQGTVRAFSWSPFRRRGAPRVGLFNRTGTSPTVSFRTRRSTCSTRRGRASSSASAYRTARSRRSSRNCGAPSKA